MTTSRTATWQWAILLMLTAMTFQIAHSGLSGPAFVLPVLFIILIKGNIVIDRFMELQGVAGPFRWIVLGWLVTVLGLIGFAFRATGELK
jgi:cytochrome c oxidase subunit 4